MLLLAKIIFFLAVFCLLHSYVFFPIILKLISKGKKNNAVIFQPTDVDLPTVSILLAVFNEASVIEEKIKSTFRTSYPLHKIEFLIGSDASTDKTNELIQQYAQQIPELKLNIFPGRTGKSGIINKLKEHATGEILILTDANVFFDSETIYQLVKHYKNEAIAQVGGNIINPVHKKEGISFQEKSYLSRENLMKYQEGVIWGCMIGAFGGCYSIRKDYFKPVPPNFLMDDFYISMHVLQEGKKALNELEATCYEDVSNIISEEFRRKVRISAGNFQNLSVYKSLLWPVYRGVSFCFMSHKVLRWYGPLFIILALVANSLLLNQNHFYLLACIGQLCLLVLPFIDILLKKVDIHIKALRFISHFYLMNLALLLGLIKYLTGVQSNVWKPTQRNQ